MTPAKVWTYGLVLNMNTPRKVSLTGQFILIRKIKKVIQNTENWTQCSDKNYTSKTNSNSARKKIIISTIKGLHILPWVIGPYKNVFLVQPEIMQTGMKQLNSFRAFYSPKGFSPTQSWSDFPKVNFFCVTNISAQQFCAIKMGPKQTKSLKKMTQKKWNSGKLCIF